jgi:hypothetical protein
MAICDAVIRDVVSQNQGSLSVQNANDAEAVGQLIPLELDLTKLRPSGELIILKWAIRMVGVWQIEEEAISRG